jgi:hypothetical protein
MTDPSVSAAAKDKSKLHKRYNKLVVIDLEKRAILRDAVKRNTPCHHKQIYTQANAICRRISSSYEDGLITKEQALELILKAHDQNSHRGLPKEVVAGEMNKQLDKIENRDGTSFAMTMANVSQANNISAAKGKARAKAKEPVNSQESDSDQAYENALADRYSESYWAEVI